MIPREKELSQCWKSYSQCVLQDYCSVFSNNSSLSGGNSGYCQKAVDWIHKDNSCREFTHRQCLSDEQSNLCQQISDSSFEIEEQCKIFLKSHCEINARDSLCVRYKDRCLVKLLFLREEYRKNKGAFFLNGEVFNSSL